MAESIKFDRPFGFVMKDPTWTKKVLMGGLFLLIPIVGFIALMGYQRKLFDALRDDPEAKLPEIDFGNDLSYGLPVFGIVLCYMLPGMILSAIPVLGQLVMAAVGLLVMPAALIRFYTTNRFGAVFEFGPIIEFVKANINNLLLYAVIGIICNFVGGVGAIACIVGMVFTMWWASVSLTVSLSDVHRCAGQSSEPSAPPAA